MLFLEDFSEPCLSDLDISQFENTLDLDQMVSDGHLWFETHH